MLSGEPLGLWMKICDWKVLVWTISGTTWIVANPFAVCACDGVAAANASTAVASVSCLSICSLQGLVAGPARGAGTGARRVGEAAGRLPTRRKRVNEISRE